MRKRTLSCNCFAIVRIVTGLALSFWIATSMAQMSNSTAQSQGLSLGSGLSSSGSLSPNSLANSSAVAPNNANNIYGAQATGVADPNLTNQSSSSALVPLGNNKVGECATQTGPTSTVAGQHCQAVNFLSGRCHLNAQGQLPTGCPQSLSANDPMLVGNNKNLQTATFDASLNQSCHSATSTLPASTQQQTCHDLVASYTSSCTKVLNPACAWVGSPITNLSWGGYAQVTNLGGGQYEYSMPMSGYGNKQYSVINFDVVAPAKGSYITATANSLDDTAVMAINNIPIFFGHPNSGPAWTYPQMGTNPGFIWGSSQPLMGDVCDGWDDWGSCISTHTEAIAWSEFQIQDSCCPAGGAICASPNQAVASSNKTGTISVWCSDSGHLVGQRVEGNYSRSIAVSATIPLRKGPNELVGAWGTEPSGDYWGTVNFTGKIYNVIPVCNTWTDNCIIQEGLVGK